MVPYMQFYTEDQIRSSLSPGIFGKPEITLFSMKITPALRVRNKAITHLLQWNLTQLYACPGSYMGSSADKWLPPLPGWFKLNFDGSFNQASISAAIGGIIKDPLGNMFSAFADRVKAMHPLEAKLLALEKVLEVCKGLQLSSLQIEGDNLVLDALAKLDFPVTRTFNAALQEPATTYTRAFCYHVDPNSDSSHIAILISDDSDNFTGRNVTGIEASVSRWS
eukprot:TRINITY_DN27156_c0_g1_i5.p1 TRINITY_DN27156_c0_g1~~TRINITY_DN27156_c0_g1_i5.p1  ORF type:complete len:222 (+),score=33.88 TRINITY_DN27156_c0_g1_i5:412-1077(+)